MKPVPQTLLKRLQALAPLGAEIVPLDWDYDGEDHNIVVVVDEGIDRRVLEEQLLDAVMDYDEEHGTFTMCLVWSKEQRAFAGVR